MENKRIVTIQIYGLKKELHACKMMSADCSEAFGAMANDYENEIVIIDGESEQRYTWEEFLDKGCEEENLSEEDLDVDEWVGECDCQWCELWSLKSCASADIELNADEPFDIEKVTIWTYNWIYASDDTDESMIHHLSYDGKQCDLTIDSDHGSLEKAWDIDDKYEDEEEYEDDDDSTSETKWGFIDKSGKLVVPCMYDDVFYFKKGLTKVEQGGKYGFIDESGTLVVPCMYDDASFFKKGLAKVQQGGKFGKYGFIDESGTLVVPCMYDMVYDFSEGMAAVKQDGKYGFIDKSGTLVVPCMYDDAYAFSEGMAIVRQYGKYGSRDGKYGIIDKSGTLVVPCMYDDAFNFKEGLAIVKQDGKYGLIDKSGTLVVPCMYEVDDFHEGMSAVKQDGKYGIIDKSGKLVIPCMYDYAGAFREGMAEVKQSGKYGFVDKSGKLVVPCMYDFVRDFREGMAEVNQSGKYGFVDKSGKLVVPCMYDFVKTFSEGMAIVGQDGKYGFIDKSGKLVVPCMYDDADAFSEGLAAVKQGGKYGFVDKSGKLVVPCMYDSVRDFIEGWAMVRQDGVEITNIKSNNSNMEGPKTRKITVEVFGREKWLDGYNECRSFFSVDEEYPRLEFTVKGKTYGPSDFGSEADLISPEESSEYKDLDVERFYTDETNDDIVLLHSQKSCSSITIYIPVGEDFDPSKAAIIARLYKYPVHTGLGCERVMMAFVYDGKIYDCLPEDSNGGSSMVIWKRKKFELAEKTKKLTVCISSTAGAKELSCGDYANFYIQSIGESVSLYVEDDAGNIIYEDEEFDLCPIYGILGYSTALNPEDEDEEDEDCVDDYRNTKFKAADFFKKAWDKLPLSEPVSSEPDFVLNLIKEAVEGDDEVEMELSSGEDEDQPLVVRFEIEVSDGVFGLFRYCPWLRDNQQPPKKTCIA